MPGAAEGRAVATLPPAKTQVVATSALTDFAGRVRHPLRLEVRVARAVEQREPLADGGAGLEPLLAHGAPEAVVVVMLPDRDVRVRARDGAGLRGARPVRRGAGRRVVADARLQLRGGRRRDLRRPARGRRRRRTSRGRRRRAKTVTQPVAASRVTSRRKIRRGRGRSVDPARGERLAVLERQGLAEHVPVGPDVRELGWVLEQYVRAGGELDATVFVSSRLALPSPSSYRQSTRATSFAGS